LRPVKAIDVLIEALAMLKRGGRRVTATIAGNGPLMDQLQAQAEHCGVTDQVRFIGHCPARAAFAMGHVVVIPSRAESLPYVALEATAAGMPLIATRVGGIPEIFGPEAGELIAPDDVDALAAALDAALRSPEQIARVAARVRARVRSEFSAAAMVDNGIAAYREAIALRKLARFL
jgi:glycosyltransferase involved in cell wall biosynthesis